MRPPIAALRNRNISLKLSRKAAIASRSCQIHMSSSPTRKLSRQSADISSSVRIKSLNEPFASPPMRCGRSLPFQRSSHLSTRLFPSTIASSRRGLRGFQTSHLSGIILNFLAHLNRLLFPNQQRSQQTRQIRQVRSNVAQPPTKTTDFPKEVN